MRKATNSLPSHLFQPLFLSLTRGPDRIGGDRSVEEAFSPFFWHGLPETHFTVITHARGLAIQKGGPFSDRTGEGRGI